MNNGENNESNNKFMTELLVGYDDNNPNNPHDVVSDETLQHLNHAENSQVSQNNNPNKFPENLKKQTINDIIKKNIEESKKEELEAPPPEVIDTQNNEFDDIDLNAYKKKMIIAGIVIVVLIGAFFFIKSKFFSGPEPIVERKTDILLNNLYKFDSDDTKLVDAETGNGFSFIRFIKKGDDYYILIKKKSFLIDKFELNIKYSYLQYKVTIENGEVVNKDEDINLSIINDRYVFKSDKYSIFNGKYDIYNSKDKVFNMPVINDGKHTGFYTSKDKEYSMVCLIYDKNEITNYNGKQVFDYGYYISGTVKDKGEIYNINLKKISGMPYENSDAALNNGYHIIFEGDNLTLKYATLVNGKVKYEDRIVNGVYKKLTTIPYDDLFADLDKNIVVDPAVPGSSI